MRFDHINDRRSRHHFNLFPPASIGTRLVSIYLNTFDRTNRADGQRHIYIQTQTYIRTEQKELVGGKEERSFYSEKVIVQLASVRCCWWLIFFFSASFERCLLGRKSKNYTFFFFYPSTFSPFFFTRSSSSTTRKSSNKNSSYQR